LLQKLVETGSEDEFGHQDEGTSEDFFVWSGTGTDTGTDEDSSWEQLVKEDHESESTGDDDVEEDLSDETTEKDIRCESK